MLVLVAMAVPEGHFHELTSRLRVSSARSHRPAGTVPQQLAREQVMPWAWLLCVRVRVREV